MGIRIPQNQIKKELYTSGGEFLIAKTQQRYKGYYYEANGKFYAGKEYKENSPELIKSTSDKVNKLLSNPFTNLYGIISRIKLNSTEIPSIPVSSNSNLLDKGGEYFLKFYYKKANSDIIKVIDEETYLKLQKDPIYQTTFIGVYNNKNQTPNDAEKQLPGIKAFLGL